MNSAGIHNILEDVLKSPMRSIMDLAFGFTLYNTIKNRSNELLTNRNNEFILWR